MDPNPYPRAKEHVPQYTLCELCHRTIKTRDWRAHKTSKKHREAEVNEKPKLENTNGSADNFGDDATSLHDSNELIDASRDLVSGGIFDHGGISRNYEWGSSRTLNTSFENTMTSSFSNSGSRGGDRVCFSCGQTGHTKGDCSVGVSGTAQSCYNCGQPGHQKRDCPANSGVRTCYYCGEAGHRKSECIQPRKVIAGGISGGIDRVCFNCNNEGHNKSECPMSLSSRNRGEGARTCYNCKREGHLSRDCPEPRVMRCRNCDIEGHQARECPKPTDWSRVKCKNCSNFGHGAKRCPEPAVETDGNDWSYDNVFGAVDRVRIKAEGNSGAAESWRDTFQESTGNWADDTIAATESNSWGVAGNTTGW